jgi:hypothetical protein
MDGGSLGGIEGKRDRLARTTPHDSPCLYSPSLANTAFIFNLNSPENFTHICVTDCLRKLSLRPRIRYAYLSSMD